jgi:hypothetical protein
MLANEYDAVQERGEVKANGGARNFSAPKRTVKFQLPAPQKKLTNNRAVSPQ